MNTQPLSKLVLMFSTTLSVFLLSVGITSANTTITVEKAVHVTTAEGSDLILNIGDYTVEPAQDWLRITPSNGTAVDAHLLETQVGKHEERLTDPLAISATGVEPDTHHLVLLLPGGKSLEATGSYTGVRSRGHLSRLSTKRLRALAAASRNTRRTEFSTLAFGGSGGNRRYNLDCGNNAALVGAMHKSGMWLDGIGIICQRVNSRTGVLEDDFTRGPVGGQGGRAKLARCGQGRVVQGIKVRSGQYINRISIRCSRWEPSRKAPIVGRFCNPNSPACLDFGGTMSAPESDLFLCPQGKVGKALRGKHGSYIDSMKFVCDFWNK